MFVDKTTGLETSIAQRCADMNASLPLDPTPEQLSLCGLAVLAQTPKPGEYFRQGENELVEGEWRTSWAAIPAEEVRGLLLASNNEAYNSATRAITSDYPQLEKDTWPTQDKESKAWVADPDNALTPWIDRAANTRGIERDEYLRRTLAKAWQFEVISSYLTGTRQKYEDQIKDGGTPSLDYSIPPEIYAEMQAQSLQIMTTPAADLQGLF